MVCSTLAIAQDYVLKQGSRLFKALFQSLGCYTEKQSGAPTHFKRYISNGGKSSDNTEERDKSEKYDGLNFLSYLLLIVYY